MNAPDILTTLAGVEYGAAVDAFDSTPEYVGWGALNTSARALSGCYARHGGTGVQRLRANLRIAATGEVVAANLGEASPLRDCLRAALQRAALPCSPTGKSIDGVAALRLYARQLARDDGPPR